MLLYAIFFALYEKAMCNIHPPVRPKEHTDLPFDVKPPTYEPIGLIPTMNLVHLCLLSRQKKKES